MNNEKNLFKDCDIVLSTIVGQSEAMFFVTNVSGKLKLN